jgi:hypothetical protein
MAIDPSKLAGPALSIARPILAEAGALWHRRGASPLDEIDPSSIDRELDHALDILSDSGGSLPDWLVKKVAALISDRPAIFSEEEVCHWLRREDVRTALKQAAISTISRGDVESQRVYAAERYAEQSSEDGWYGAVAFDFALAYLLRTLDAKLPFEARVVIGAIHQRADRLEELVAGQTSRLDAYLALIENRVLVERAEARGLSIVQIENLLTRFGHSGAPVEQAEKLLLDAADQLKQVRARLLQFSDADPEVAQWKTTALAAIDTGDLQTARDLLNQAAERDLDAVREIEASRIARRLNASDTVAQLARLSSAEANFSEAASSFGRAARIAEPVDLDAAWWLWIDAAEAHARSAEVFPDLTASRAAVETVRRHNLPMALASADTVKLQRAYYELAVDLLALSERVPDAEALPLRTDALEQSRRSLDLLPENASPTLRITGLSQLGDTHMAIARAVAGNAGVDAARAAVQAFSEAGELASRVAQEFVADCAASLGSALRLLSDRTPEPEASASLSAAIAEYRKALAAPLASDRRPEVLNLLGAAYLAVAERGGGNLAAEYNQNALTIFEEAIASLDSALYPLSWAQTVSNAALAERRIATVARDDEALRRVIARYNSILTIYTPTQLPSEWARTMNNLGSATMTLAMSARNQDDSARLLADAIVAFEDALLIRQADPTSTRWLDVQNNLGLAYRHLATRSDGELEAEYLRRSVAFLATAAAGRSSETEPSGWATSSANLAMSEALLAENIGDLALLDQALSRLDQAIAVMEREGLAGDLREAREQRAMLQTERDAFEETARG